MKETFRKELQSLLNRFSIDNYCGTPDFQLADVLCEQLETVKRLNTERDQWHGFKSSLTREPITHLEPPTPEGRSE